MAERTKLWIADKMKGLMKKKPIEKIRITEICQAADITLTREEWYKLYLAAGYILP